MIVLIPTLQNKFSSKGEKKKITGPKRWEQTLVEEFNKSIKDTKVKSCEFLECLKILPSTNIIHFYVASPLNLFLLIWARILNKKSIFTLHGDIYEEYKNKTGIKKLLWLPIHNIFINFTNKVTFPSKYLYNRIKAKNRNVLNKGTVILNGISEDTFKQIKEYKKSELGITGKTKLMLTVTNFNLKGKACGIEVLCKEFEKFNKQNNDYILYIVGSGSNLERISSVYQSEYIKFLGYKEDVLELIKSCDLFAYYSYLDNLPYVLLEALIAKKPIQALPTGGIPEILPAKYITNGPLKEINVQSTIPADITSQRMAYEFNELYKKIQ